MQNHTIFFAILFVILFAAWQLHVIIKYNFGYIGIRVDSKNSKLIAGNQSYKFSDIKAIRIIPSENQPAVYERALSKGAAYVYLSTIELYMKNNSIIQLKCNSKLVVNKLKSDLAPYIDIVNEELPTEVAGTNPFLFQIAVILTIFFIVFIICVVPH